MQVIREDINLNGFLSVEKLKEILEGLEPNTPVFVFNMRGPEEFSVANKVSIAYFVGSSGKKVPTLELGHAMPIQSE